MKKLRKLTINPEKVLKNEELVNLKGGYDGFCGTSGLMCYGPCYTFNGMGTCTPTLGGGCICK